MTYALPPAGTAQASWVGETAYTLPGAGMASATWVPGPPPTPAAETAPTLGVVVILGAPRVVTFADAAGTATVNVFGTPTYVQVSPAAGVLTTIFGTPSHPSPQVLDATGFLAASLGRPVSGTFTPPTIHRSLSASGAKTTEFGTATTATTVSVSGTGALTTVFGVPTHGLGQRAAGVAPETLFGAAGIRMAGQAASVRFGAFGAPASGRMQPATSIGATTAVFGAPTPMRGQSASGAAPEALFGYAGIRVGVQASGVKLTEFGAPTSGRMLLATSIYRATRGGTAGTVRSDTFTARGAHNPARFAQPSAKHLNAYQASGTCSTQVGALACYLRYRALHAAPTCRTGRPLLIRGTPC